MGTEGIPAGPGLVLGNEARAAWGNQLDPEGLVCRIYNFKTNLSLDKRFVKLLYIYSLK